jgi:hypothetical protein
MDIVGLTDLASDIGALGISIIVIWAAWPADGDAR